MTILLVQLPTSLVSFEDRRFPDRDDSQILDHLIFYCSKFESIPAITVAVSGSSAIVIRGHKYLLAARALNRPNIRAVVATPPSNSEEVDRFVAREGVVKLNWEEIQASETSNKTPMGWHVFFFERALSSDEKRDFENRIEVLFRGVPGSEDISVRFDDDRKLAEFEACTPVGDQAWASKHLATFAAFSRERARIISFQGRKFAG